MNRESHYRGLIALQLVSGLGLQRARMLLQHKDIKTASDLFACSISELMRTDGIGENIARNLAGFRDWKQVDKILSKTEKIGARLIAFDDEKLPKAPAAHLRSPSDPLGSWEVRTL